MIVNFHQSVYDFIWSDNPPLRLLAYLEACSKFKVSQMLKRAFGIADAQPSNCNPIFAPHTSPFKGCVAYVKVRGRKAITELWDIHHPACLKCANVFHTRRVSKPWDYGFFKENSASSTFNCKFMGSSCEVNLTSFTEFHPQAEKLAKVITVAAGRTDEKINVWSIFFIVSPIVHTEHSAVWGHSHRWEHTWQHRHAHFSRVEVCVCVRVCVLWRKKIVRKPQRNLCECRGGTKVR